MNTCQTSMKTDTLLLCLGSLHLAYQRHETPQWFFYRIEQKGVVKRANTDLPNTDHDETTETIIASCWSAQPTSLSAFRNRIPSGKTPISAPDITKTLKVHARNAGKRTAFTMHFFRSGGALTRALAWEDLSAVMQRAFWKKPSATWKYLRLMEVVIFGSEGNLMVTGVSPEQYRETNEFGLPEQSRHWAAFGNAPMV